MPRTGSRSRYRSPRATARHRGQPRRRTRSRMGRRHAQAPARRRPRSVGVLDRCGVRRLFADPQAGLTDEHAVVEPGPTDIVRGALFVLGRHRLRCGDATSAGDATRLLSATTPRCWRKPRQLLGSVGYAGQYQQRPAPAGGAVFKSDWFQYYDELPRNRSMAQSWDMAFKDRNNNDDVVGLVAGRRGADIDLMDWVKGQWSCSESCRQVERLSQKYPKAHTMLVEDAANGPAMIDARTHKMSGSVPVPPQGGKRSRARAARRRSRLVMSPCPIRHRMANASQNRLGGRVLYQLMISSRCA